MPLEDILKMNEPSTSDIMQAISKLVETSISNHKEVTTKIIDTKKVLELSVGEIKGEINKIHSRIDGIENKVDANDTCIANLQSQINFLQQTSLKCDIMVSGFPVTINDKDEVLIKLNSVYNFGLDNIESAYMKSTKTLRSGRSGRGVYNQFYIKFKNSESKDHVMLQVRANGPLKLKQLYPTSSNGEQTINLRDKLTPTNTNIMKQLLGLKKKQYYQILLVSSQQHLY